MISLTVLCLALAATPESIPAVSGDVFSKAGRFEVTPSATLSVKDAFYRKYVFGLEASYHFRETFSVGGYAGYALTTPARAMQICGTVDAPYACGFPTAADLDGRASGQVVGLAGLDLVWAPIYGKVSLFAESFVNFDLYLLAGAALVGYRGPADGGGSVFRPGLGGKVGLGTRIFLTRSLALRASAQDLAYSEVVRRGDVTRTLLHQEFFIELGLSLFFPMPSERDR